MVKKRKRVEILFWCIGLLLMGMGMSLLLYNFWDNHRVGVVSENILLQLEEIQKAEQEKEEKKEKNPLYMTNPEMEMPTVEIDENWFIGKLDIPSLGLSLPVMEEWSYPKLKLSPCRYSGSVYEDNLIIAAHNYGKHFGNIKNLRIGDSLTFTDMEGNCFEYLVAEVEQLEPEGTEEIQQGDWELTLFTCTIGGSYRVVVRCVLA
jgi:sortase A